MKKMTKLAVSVASVALAASLVIGGGTLAYLRAESGSKVNTFQANLVGEPVCEITETKNDYSIVPGTSAEKDPTVHVANTVDAYVFVEVTDTTDGLVEYTIAEGWTLLDGYDNIYYRVVPANEAGQSQSFEILKDNKVSYDAALENSDMLDEDGALKEGLELTFKAYAIQKEPFASAAEAWAGKDSKAVANAADLVEAVKAGTPAILEADMTLTQDLATVMADAGVAAADINLNGHTLTLGVEQHVENGAALKIQNGSVAHTADAQNNANAFNVSSGGSATIEDVSLVITGSSTATYTPTAFFVRGDASEVNVLDSEVRFAEGSNGTLIGTNAGSEANYNVVINVKNSTVAVSESDGWTSLGILLNVPGELNIENSTITGEVAAVAVRGGTAHIKDSKLIRAYAPVGMESYGGEENYFMNGDWGSGNSFPLSTLLLGNRGPGYQYAADVTLENTTITALTGKTVYVYGNATADIGASLNYDEACSLGNVQVGGGYVTVNGVVQ